MASRNAASTDVSRATGGLTGNIHSAGKYSMNPLLRIYVTIVLICDILSLVVRAIYSMLEGIVRLVIPAYQKSVAGEIVLITGAGHGIGRELAEQFAELGATIVSWDINDQGNKETVERLQKLGHKAHAYRCDVSNREEVLKMAEKVRKEVGEVTVLVNNAGIMPCHALNQHNPQEIKRMFDINVFAHFWTMEAFLPTMVNNNHGHIVALSSMAGIMGIPNLVPYCASKFAVRGMMEALREEYREDARNLNIKFTTIYPFIVDTGLCQKPRTRFPSLLGIVPPKKAAQCIITAMRTDALEASIPGSLMFFNNLMRLFPAKVGVLFRDFMDSGVGAHDT